MKKRIFRSICVVALFSMLIATWTATSIIGQETNRKTHEDVRREVHYLAAGLEEDGSKYLNELEKLKKRIRQIRIIESAESPGSQRMEP